VNAPRKPVLALAERPDTLTHVVLEAIRSAIVNQELPTGTRVTEAGLARQLNVSKTPVREALLQLREIGLIEPDERRGGRILSPSRTGISDAYEVREALEVFAAGAAAARADERAIKRIERIAHRSLRAARAGDLEGFKSADAEFHRAVAAAAGNDRLELSIERSLTLVSALRQRDVPGPAGSIECGQAHLRVAAAVRDRDVAGASGAMSAHVRRVSELVLAAYDECHAEVQTSSVVASLTAAR
jgi:GntR family transcriptional regulator, rspAB operon transcriptional repressor